MLVDSRSCEAEHRKIRGQVTERSKCQGLLLFVGAKYRLVTKREHKDVVRFQSF